jgi:hypothetical protein
MSPAVQALAVGLGANGFVNGRIGFNSKEGQPPEGQLPHPA